MSIPCHVAWAAVLGLIAPLASAAPAAVEYFHAGYNHYFVTASPAEVARLDAGAFRGWSRTGESFPVLEVGTPGALPVCRFWSGDAYAPTSSHFYTSDAAECAKVQRESAVWQFEGEAFAVAPALGGVCSAGVVPLYRLYNDGAGGAPNHRYTIDPVARAQMVAQGWRPEGAGPGVIGCVPSSGIVQKIAGRVPAIEGATVCLDVDANGRCSAGEPQAVTDATGRYTLDVAKESTAALVAEIVAGVAREAGSPSVPIEASYRLATPRTYGTDLTPYATLVYLMRTENLALAEDLARVVVGLPPNFDLRYAATPSPGSLQQTAAAWMTRALRANGLALDLAAPGALATVTASFPIALTELPRLTIATRDAAPIISRETYVDATFALVNPAAAVPEVALAGKIRGRGHSTWGQPKNPYKVQFANDAAYAAIGDVLGMKKQRNWALLADYFDRSLMRNKLALSLGASSVFADGLRWTPSGQHVEVWLNGDYVGVYLLTEDIRIDPARLPLKKMGSGDVDGGYIVEADMRLDCYHGTDLDLGLVTPHGTAFCVDTPDEESITPAQLAYVKQLLLDVEADVYGPHRTDRLHRESFADWYLIQELFRNNDAQFFSSDFMWKDASSAANPKHRLLNMGPLWDFDRSAGNVDDNGNWVIEGCWVARPVPYNWMGELLDEPAFLALTLERWKRKRPAIEAFVTLAIDHYARRLQGAQLRNFQRWPIFGVPLTNHYRFDSHDAEVAFVRRFLTERMAWMDRALETPESFHALCH